MKKYIAIILAAITVLTAFGWSRKEEATTHLKEVEPIAAVEEDLSIWIITDMHYLSPELFDDGKAFARMKATAAGKDLEHMPAIMDALVWEAEKEQPDLLIVSGDLTFNGEYQSMVELADYFSQIEANGTQVAVIPGNHDIHSGWARKFSGEEMARVEQVTPEDFKTLFADYGYDLATFEDPTTLSYVIEPKAGFPFFMLDTNIYTETKSTRAPIADGEITAETYTWLDEYFTRQTDAKEVYLIGHHPLLNHSGREGGKFALADSDQALNYFSEKGIQTSFAGHIHAQNITKTEQNFHEIITGALSIYPNSIGTVTLSNDRLAYTRKKLDVSGWAEATGKTHPALLDYSQTSYDFFKKDGETLALGMMFEEQWHDKALQTDVMDFVGTLNVRYFAGEDFDPDPSLTEHPGYQIIQENSKTFLKRYSNQLLLDENLDDRQIVIPHQ